MNDEELLCALQATAIYLILQVFDPGIMPNAAADPESMVLALGVRDYNRTSSWLNLPGRGTTKSHGR
jgi:hypothetical protein